jgi:hypothetical protein
MTQTLASESNSPPRFATIEPVELRTCWADEARNFTPWLASHEGLTLLGRTLGMELQVEGQEVAVGPYNADILARDLTSNVLVVIENQLEKTDHDHFGKVLTYAAVLGASAVVWIARTFTEEHRKAVDWLNELTKGDLLLYGVEVHVWRIDGSRPAPWFEVVCSPNEVVRQAAVARESDESSETKQLQLEFWTEVRKHLDRTGNFPTLQKPGGRYWFDIALGRANIHLSLFANTWDKRIGVRVYLGHQVADRALEQLLPQRSEIEREVGSALEWNPHPEKRDQTIRLVRDGDIADRDSWPELIEWMTKTAVDCKKAFGPRVARLDLAGTKATPTVTD